MRTLAARILLGTIDLDADTLAVSPLRPPEVGAFLGRLVDANLSSEDQARVGATIVTRVSHHHKAPPVELEAWFADWFANLGRRVAEVDGLYVTA
jgi:hypothetical protein